MTLFCGSLWRALAHARTRNPASTATAPGTGTSTATKSGDNMDHASETADKMRWFSAPRILSVSATSVVM